MKNIGSKLKEIRIRKGLSQDELSELSNVSLRTIQRIEQNHNEPRGNTLHLICAALNIDVEEVLEYGKEEKSDFMVYFHLSVLSFIVLPVGNIILPLILWLTKRDKIIGLDETGKSVLYFQVVWTILSFMSFMAFVIAKITWNNEWSTYLYLTLGFYIINIIFSIFNATRSAKKKKNINYIGILSLK